MKKQAINFFIIIFFICAASVSFSQAYIDGYTLKFSALDVTTDAKSLSLGESFVANNMSAYSFFENPAAIKNSNDISFFYNYRSHGWINYVKDANFSSFGISSKFPFGKFGFMYNRFTSGQYNSDPLNTNVTSELISRSFILAYAYDIIDNITAGISAKIYNRSLETNGNNLFSIKSNNSLLFDFGFIWMIGSITKDKTLNDNFNFGLSIQNYGTDYEEEMNFTTTEIVKTKIARFLHAGFSYNISFILGQITQANLDILICGEYKRLLNPGYKETHNVDYWGIGTEATLFKIISLRIGSIINNENNVIYERAKLLWRYGIGLNFPFALLGLNKPLSIHFDYTSLPINSIKIFDMNSGNAQSKENLYAFSVTVNYLFNFFDK